MKLRRYATRIFETKHKISRSFESMQGGESREHESLVGASLMNKRECVEGGGGYLVQDGVCVTLEQLAETVQRAETALTVEELFGWVLAGLRRGKGLASAAKCVGEGKCVVGVRMIYGDARMVFVKSGFTSRGVLF